MSRGLTPTEFYKALSKEYKEETGRDIGVNVVQDLWVAFSELTLTELLQYGSIRIPLFGTILVQERGNKEIIMPNSKDDMRRLNTKEKYRMIYVESFLKPRLKFTDGFVDMLNGKKPSRYQIFNLRKRIRKEQDKKLREEQEAIVIDKQETFQQVFQNRLDKIHKAKAEDKLSNKKKLEKEQQEKIDSYGY